MSRVMPQKLRGRAKHMGHDHGHASKGVDQKHERCMFHNVVVCVLIMVTHQLALFKRGGYI